MFKQTLAILGALLIAGTAAAQSAGPTRNRNEAQKRAESRNELRYRFVDENGDGICDYNRDHDGDGIPNGRDADWVAPKDGTGYKTRSGRTLGAGSAGGNVFQRDADGDGIPNGQDPDWTRPQDGTGYKGRFGTASFRANAGAMTGFGAGLGRRAFTRNRDIVRPGVCTGTGPGKFARRSN